MGCGVDEPLAHDRAEGIGELDVDGGLFVEGVGSFVGFVDDLVGDHEVAWGDGFAEGSDGAGGDDVGDA